MLAESLEESDQLSQESVSRPSSTGTRRRGLRASISVDPQTTNTRSKKMVENWSWSFPPPEKDTSRHPENPDGI